MSTLVYWAFFSGGIAAFSLTLGSFVGLTLRIPSYIIGILAAFGAGALLSALAIELVAPTVEHLVTAETPQEIYESKHSFFVLIGGCIVGFPGELIIIHFVLFVILFSRSSGLTLNPFSNFVSIIIGLPLHRLTISG